MKGKLILSDGTIFEGEPFGSQQSTSGEVVFNTGMVGYPESLTDPSYYGQILVLTYPLQGNYGVPDKKFWESGKIQVKGLVVSNYIDHPSHFESQKTLGKWLKEQDIPALQGIDTRALTTKLRQHGVMLGRIELGSGKVPSEILRLPFDKLRVAQDDNSRLDIVRELSSDVYDPNKENILPYVSCKGVRIYGEGKKNIVLIDCGVKENIIRSLVKRGVRVTRVPWDFDPIANPPAGVFDGVVVSNGPGDPKQAKQTIQNVAKLLQKGVPIFGICLGNQILALAAGGDTYKLKFGHRGQNQPVIDCTTKKAIITSQNHGFAVDMKTLGKDWQEWFVNLNDGTNEGIRHRKNPFMAVQFHPEANPGPVDSGYLFDEFLSYIK